jgi:serine/threonine protein phosphatase 1
MQQLPLYIVLDTEHASGKPVVISHASVAAVWNLRHNDAMRKTFEETALWSRRSPDEDAEIFNIFGHTVTPYSAKVRQR